MSVCTIEKIEYDVEKDSVILLSRMKRISSLFKIEEFTVRWLDTSVICWNKQQESNIKY